MRLTLTALATGLILLNSPASSAGNGDPPPIEVRVTLEGPINAALKARAMAEVCNLRDLTPGIKQATDAIVLSELRRSPELAGRLEVMGYYSAVYRLAYAEGLRAGLAPGLDDGKAKVAICRSADRVIREGYPEEGGGPAAQILPD